MMRRFRLLALGLFLLSATAPLLAAPIEVGGVVLDPRGKGLAGATAELLPRRPTLAIGGALLEGKIEPAPAATAASDAAGRFRLSAPEPGMWTVRVRAQGFVPREMSLLPLLEEASLPEVRLETATPLRIEVLDSAGRPLPGALVTAGPDDSLDRAFARRIWEPWQDAQSLAFTGTDGSVSVAAGSSPLEVSAGAGRHLVSRQKAGGQARVQIRLERGCDAVVEVLDREKRPVAGALVGNQGISGQTDAAGRLAVTLPCGRDNRVKATLPDWRQAEAVLPAKRAQGEPVRLVLPPQPARLNGRVLEEGTGKPVAGAFVWSAADPGMAVRTDANGRYTLTVPAGQALYLQAAALGSLTINAQRSALPGPGSQDGPTFALPPASLASGIVVDEAGRPVEGAGLQASSEGRFRLGDLDPTRSGPRGTFRLRLASGQAYQLTARHPAFAPAVVPVAEIAPRAARTDLRIVLKKGLTATGTVRDESERPVAGAKLTLSPGFDERRAAFAAFTFGGPQPLEAISGADGRFTFEHLEAGRFDLRAQAAGFGPVEVPGLEIKAGPRPTSLGTVILHPGLKLTGTVVDARSRPIAGAKVAAGGSRFPSGFVAPDEEDAPGVATGADGSFTLADLSAGQRLQIGVTKEGYAPRRLSGIELPSQPLRIVLAAGGRIAGRVVDEEGKPLYPAFVEIGQSGSGPMFGGRTLLLGQHAQVEESGQFEVRDLEAGTFTVRASAEGYRSSEKAGLELTAGAELTGVEIVLRKGAVVAGQVLGPEGKPVAEANIAVADGRGFSFSMERATTDGDGRYRLEGVEPGSRAFTASHEDFDSSVRDLEVQPGENRLDFRLAGGYPLSGRVAGPTGEPVEGAELSLFATEFRGQLKHERSGADGGFRFENVGAGTYGLSVSREGYAQTLRKDVEVRGPVAGLEIRLERGGAIRGRILGVDFSDLKGLQIGAHSASAGAGRGFLTGQADFQGQYRIVDVGAGEWTVTAALPQSGRRAEGKVTVEEGAEAVLDLDLNGGGLTLSGRVTRRGEPVGDVRIVAQGTEHKGGSSAQTNYDGLFRISGLEPGTYQISAMVRFSLSRQQTVTLTSDQEIAIELPDSRITGQVVDAADFSPVEGATVTAQPTAGEPDPRWPGLRSGTASDSAGTFTLTDVGEGSLKVTARKEGYSPAETTVEAGGSGTVDGLRLTLKATQGLTIQVVAPAGPPAGIDVALLDPNGTAVLTGSYPVAEGGRARISEAPPGRWTLLASTGTALASLEVTVPGPAVSLQLLPTTTLRVTVPDLAGSSALAKATVLGADGRPYRALRYGGFLSGDWSVSNGQAVLDNLPQGTWRVVVTAPDGHTWQGTATTAPGAEAAVVLK